MQGDSKSTLSSEGSNAAAGVQKTGATHSALVPAQVAKAALRRLLQDQLEPTPSNYERAYLQESGAAGSAKPAIPELGHRLVERLAHRFCDAAGGGPELAQALLGGQWAAAESIMSMSDEGGSKLSDLIDRVVKGVSRGGRHWTTARKKESLQRVLSGSRNDSGKLQKRLNQLLTNWDDDTPGEAVDTDVSPLDELKPSVNAAPAAHQEPLLRMNLGQGVHRGADVSSPEAQSGASSAPLAWSQALSTLSLSLQQALPTQEKGSATELSESLGRITESIKAEGATEPLVGELGSLCIQANRVLLHRHHLVEQLRSLCQELTASIADLAEDESWAQGQCDAMRVALSDGLTVRGVKSVSELLHNTRERQLQLRQDRERARDSLKTLIGRMLSELGELGSQTGRFSESVGRYADVIDKADSLESLAGVVHQMVEESRTVQALVSQAHARLEQDHSNATSHRQRVAELEDQLTRLAQEVSTDQLTQVANRRGLIQAFEVERSRIERATASGSGGEPSLSVGLLDIDNFKKLNDELGHAVGDVALKSLAETVSKSLRPTDMVARYGGEEFVVLMPNTPALEGQEILTRLQRSLSVGLFMHENKKVFVTFSAGVTTYRRGEQIEQALERADQALYEAKRSGKNRTCLA